MRIGFLVPSRRHVSRRGFPPIPYTPTHTPPIPHTLYPPVSLRSLSVSAVWYLHCRISSGGRRGGGGEEEGASSLNSVWPEQQLHWSGSIGRRQPDGHRQGWMDGWMDGWWLWYTHRAGGDGTIDRCFFFPFFFW